MIRTTTAFLQGLFDKTDIKRKNMGHVELTMNLLTSLGNKYNFIIITKKTVHKMKSASVL
jgi:hypothetical protein